MDTNALQTLVGTCGMVTLPKLTFSIDKPVWLRSGTIIEGNGSVIESHYGGHVFLVHGVHDISIRGIEIRGRWLPNSDDDSATLGAGIQIQESRNVMVDGVRIVNMPGRGIVAASHVDDLRIRGCYIDGCAISVFLFKGVRYGRVESCHIFNSRIMGICIDDATEGDTQDTALPNEHTIVSGNVVVYGGTSPRNMGVGIAVSGSTDTVVSGNIVRCFGNKDRVGHGIVLNNGQASLNPGLRTVVSGNILSDHAGYGLYCMGQQSCVESGNVYSGNGLGDCKSIPDAQAGVA